MKSFIRKHCNGFRNSHWNNNTLKRKRKLFSYEYEDSKRRRISDVIKEEDMFDEICDKISYVPFPSQAKINGVIIEEIKDDVDENTEENQVMDGLHGEIILAPELIKYLDSYPLQILRRRSTDDRALVLYKPIQSVYQENIDSDSNVSCIDKSQFNSKITINEGMDCNDVEME